MNDDAEPVDELELIAQEAAELGVAVPEVERSWTPGPHRLSALRWRAAPVGAPVAAPVGSEDAARAGVLLHGAGLNAHTWDATLLAGGLTALGGEAVAIDLPGHGRSDWRDDFDYRPQRNAETIVSSLTALGLGAAPRPWIGQSLGGVTALAIAAAAPQLVSALMLVDVTPGLRAQDAASVRQFIAAGPLVFASRSQLVEIAAAQGLGGSRSALERAVQLNTRVREDGTVVFRHHLGTPPPGAGIDLDFTPLWPALEGLEVPVLLVRADRGFLPPEVVAEFRERVPRAQVAQLDAGHNVQEDEPRALARLLAGFLG